jgi:hypothetical protein
MQVAELAELLQDGPWRMGPVDEVLQAAAEGRGMTLVLTDPPARRSRPAGPGTAASQSRRRGHDSWPPQ